jgi:hypothetical protein
MSDRGAVDSAGAPIVAKAFACRGKATATAVVPTAPSKPLKNNLLSIAVSFLMKPLTLAGGQHGHAHALREFGNLP